MKLYYGKSFNYCYFQNTFIDYEEISLLPHHHIFHLYLKEKHSTICNHNRDQISMDNFGHLQIRDIHMVNSTEMFILV